MTWRVFKRQSGVAFGQAALRTNFCRWNKYISLSAATGTAFDSISPALPAKRASEARLSETARTA